METGKAHFIREAEEARRRARDAKTAARAARQRYEETAAELQPRIDELSRKADELAAKFKRLYEESQARYEARDGSIAKELAMEGHDAENRCRRLNEEANSLRNELKGLWEEYKNRKAEADKLERESAAHEIAIRKVRRTRVRNFGESAIGSNLAVEEFLDTFPQGLLKGVVSITYSATASNKRGQMGYSKIFAFSGREITTIFPHEDADGLKMTIAHEIAHLVFFLFMSVQENKEWDVLDKAMRARDAKLISPAAVWDSVENFCECFAVFQTQSHWLQGFDRKAYNFIEKIYKKLPQ